jgi:hypothetical protein
MTVTLDSAEVAMAQITATMRHTCNQVAGVRNAKIGKQSDYITELEGVCGEMAFGKMTNLFLDQTIHPRSGGHDFLGRNKEKIDVKTTSCEHGHLSATLKKKREDADYYVLVIGKCPTYRIAGYASADDLLKKENIGNLGGGPSYLLSQSQLQTYKTRSK